MKKQNKKYYVYALINSIDNKVFYIGKGSGRRIYHHEWFAKNWDGKSKCQNTHLYRKIKKIIRNGGNIKYEFLYYNDDEKKCLQEEQNKILQYGIDNLCNLTTGGESPVVTKESIKKGIDNRHKNGKPWHSKETIRKIREKSFFTIHAGKSWEELYGKEKAEKMKQKQSGNGNGMYGKNHSEETRRKMSANQRDRVGKNNTFYGKHHTQKTREYYRELYSNKYNMIDADGHCYSNVRKKEIKEIIQKYNIENNDNVSFTSIWAYGKNGHGWILVKLTNKKYGKNIK